MFGNNLAYSPLTPIRPIEGVELYQGDSRVVLSQFPANSFDAIIGSPPHWTKLSYLPEDSPLKDQEIGLEPDPNTYLDTMGQVYAECFRLAVPCGALVVDMTDTSNNISPIRRRLKERKENAPYTRRRKMLEQYREKELLSVTDWLRLEIMAAGWMFRREIIWVKTKGGQLDDGYGRADQDTPPITHQKILYFVKPSRERGREYAAYFRDVGGGTVWFADPVKDDIHPCPMPKPIADKAIRMCCPPGGRILDPFCGSGTTLLVAARDSEGTERQAVGVDLSQEFIARACDRIVVEGSQPFSSPTVAIPATVGTCPPEIPERSLDGKAHPPTGWVELKNTEKKSGGITSRYLFRYKDGKHRRSKTLETYAEEVLCRILCWHRIYHQDTLDWLNQFRSNPKRTLEDLPRILPPTHLEAIRDMAALELKMQEADEVDKEVDRLLGGIGISRI